MFIFYAVIVVSITGGIHIFASLNSSINSDSLKIKKLTHTAFSGVNFETVEFTIDENRTLFVESISFSYSLPAAILGKIYLRSLEIQGLRFIDESLPEDTTIEEKSSESPEPLSVALPFKPPIPFPIEIGHLAIQIKSVKTRAIEIKNISLISRFKAYGFHSTLHLGVNSETEPTTVVIDDRVVELNWLLRADLIDLNSAGVELRLNQVRLSQDEKSILVPKVSFRSDTSIDWLQSLVNNHSHFRVDSGNSGCSLSHQINLQSFHLRNVDKLTNYCFFDLDQIIGTLGYDEQIPYKFQGSLELDFIQSQFHLLDPHHLDNFAKLNTKIILNEISGEPLTVSNLTTDLALNLEKGIASTNLDVLVEKAAIAGDLPIYAPETKIKLNLSANSGTIELKNFNLEVESNSMDIESRSLDISVKSSAHQSGDTINSDTVVELSKLLTNQTSFAFNLADTTFDLTSNTNLQPLEDIWGHYGKIMVKYIPIDLIPTKISGEINQKIEAKGIAPLGGDLNAALESLNLKAKTDIKSVNLTIPKNNLSLRGLSTSVDISAEHKSLKIDFKNSINKIAASHQGKNLFAKNFAVSSNLATVIEAIETVPSTIRLNLNSSIKDIKFDTLPTLPQYQLSSNIAIEDLLNIHVNKLHIKLPDFGVDIQNKVVARLNDDFSPKSITGQLKVNLADSQLSYQDLKLNTSGAGKLSVGYTLKDDFLDIKGTQSFENYGLVLQQTGKQDLVVTDMLGSIPINRQIYLGDQSSLDLHNDVNVLRHLMYPSIQSHFPDEKPFSIKTIQANGIEVSEVTGSISVTQDEINISNMAAKLLNGTTEINLTAAVTDEISKVSANIGFNQLDSSELLNSFPKVKRKLSSSLFNSDPRISGSIALNGDLTKKSLSGAIKISEIGNDQMLCIIYFLDPEEKDSSFDNIRSALKVGDISYVFLPIENGQLSVNMGVSVAAVPVPLPEIKGLPLVKIIENFVNPSENISNREYYESI